MATLNGQNLGTIRDEAHSKNAQLFQQPMPQTPSTDAVVLDLFGASRNIVIQGVWSISNGTISTFISWLDGLVNGTQARVDYVSDKTGVTYHVFVDSTRWSARAGDINEIEYEIQMIEAGSISS